MGSARSAKPSDRAVRQVRGGPGRTAAVTLILLALAVVACNKERAAQRVTVTPGVTVFSHGGVLPGDMITCRASNGSVGAGAPERGGEVSNSASVTVSTDANGVVTASCAPSISSS